MQIHKEEGNDMKCNICGHNIEGELDALMQRVHKKSSPIEQEGNEHISSDTDDCEYTCTECSFQTNNNSILKRHFEIKHDNIEIALIEESFRNC